MSKSTEDTDISFDDYNDLCSDCTSHDTCHKNGSIDYDKVAKCKNELRTQKPHPLLNDIIAFESGELSPQQQLELFAELIKNGMAWTLQGMYGRTAMDYIRAGYIDRAGNILKNIEEDDSEA